LVANVVAPPWYNGYRFVLTFIVCTSIVFNLIVKEYLQDSGSTHGKLVDLKTARQNIKGIEFGDKAEESAKQKYPPSPHPHNPVSSPLYFPEGCR
jgi:hypothetical protein